MSTEISDRVASLTVKATADGSPTLYVPELNEHYHSVHGALQESLHVFIEAGLKPLLNSGLPFIRIFEVGFGTGLNAILTFSEANKTRSEIKYDTIEAFPLPLPLVQSLKVGEILQDEELASAFDKLHAAEWEQSTSISPYFTLHKHTGKLQEANLEALGYNVIYFDAFAPEKQPELWEADIFEKLYLCLQPGGWLVTYCAKGIVKRRLRASGFLVESLPGPPHKREMIRALRCT